MPVHVPGAKLLGVRHHSRRAFWAGRLGLADVDIRVPVQLSWRLECRPLARSARAIPIARPSERPRTRLVNQLWGVRGSWRGSERFISDMPDACTPVKPEGVRGDDGEWG